MKSSFLFRKTLEKSRAACVTLTAGGKKSGAPLRPSIPGGRGGFTLLKKTEGRWNISSSPSKREEERGTRVCPEGVERGGRRSTSLIESGIQEKKRLNITKEQKKNLRTEYDRRTGLFAGRIQDQKKSPLIILRTREAKEKKEVGPVHRS